MRKEQRLFCVSAVKYIKASFIYLFYEILLRSLRVKIIFTHSLIELSLVCCIFK